MITETNPIAEAVLNDLFERGEHSYKTTLRSGLLPGQDGQFAALHADNGEHEIARSASEAICGLLLHPLIDCLLYIREIGSELKLGLGARLSGTSVLMCGTAQVLS